MRQLGFLLIALASPALGAEPLNPGIPIGQRPGPYSFLVATGPQRGQQTCYICEQGDKPTVVVFARTLSDDLGKLLVKLDEQAVAKKDAGLKIWMTQLTESADLEALAKWGQKQGLKNLPVGAFEDADGPPAYKLHANAEATVLLFVKQKVVACFAFAKNELTEAKREEVLKSLPKLFP
jgi:hypothetical protein